MELDPLRQSSQNFADRSFTAPTGKHDISVLDLNGSVDDQNIPGKNSCTQHGIAVGTVEEGSGGVPNEQIVQVEGIVQEVICGGGEAQSDTRPDDWEPDERRVDGGHADELRGGVLDLCGHCLRLAGWRLRD